MGEKLKEASIKISVYDDSQPESLRNKLKKIPLVKIQKQSEQEKFKNNIGASLSKGSKNDQRSLKYGRMENIKLPEETKKKLKERKKQILNEYWEQAQKRYSSQQQFGGCTSEEEVSERNALMQKTEYEKM